MAHGVKDGVPYFVPTLFVELELTLDCCAPVLSGGSHQWGTNTAVDP
jgi:hypothetical protein